MKINKLSTHLHQIFRLIEDLFKTRDRGQFDFSEFSVLFGPVSVVFERFRFVKARAENLRPYPYVDESIHKQNSPMNQTF